MTCINDMTSKRRPSAKVAAAFIVSAILVFGALPASAADHRNQHRDYHHDWTGGYYRAPPVVYGSTYGPGYYGSPYYGGPTYAPPPVVYGPGIGISLPGISIGIP